MSEGGNREIGEEYVGAGDEIANNFPSGLGAVVEGDTALVAVVVFEEVGEREGFLAGGLGADVAARVAEVLVLDLNDVGAHVGEEGADHGPLLACGQLDDRYTFEDHRHG